MDEIRSCKTYVSVMTEFLADGQMRPRSLVWENGTRYEIDRVLSVRPSYSAKAGGQGDRYTILVNGQRTYLFFERSAKLTGDVIGRWFVERKAQS